MRGEAVVAALLALSCSGADSEDDASPIETGTPGECFDTWESWAGGFMRTWCTSCHSSKLAEGRRYDAPLGVDFDTWETTVVFAALIEQVATGDDRTMPPVGGPGEADRERLATWISCGAPGVGIPTTGVCDGPPAPHGGDVVVATAGDAADLCAGATSVSGDLVVRASADLSCLCEVTGDVVVEGAVADVALPNLATIGGSWLSTAAPGLVALDLDQLRTVGGSVTVDGAALDALRIPELRSVEGSLQVSNLPDLERVDLSRLETVGGALVLADNPSFEVLLGEGYALKTVGGDLVLDDLDAWFGFYGFGQLLTVGGTLRIQDNDVVSRINGFTFLSELGGLHVEGNASLDAIDGFDLLPSIDGDLQILSHPQLVREEAFGSLDTIGGTLRIAGNASFESLEGLRGLTSVGALRIEGNGAMRQLGPWDLQQVAGDLGLVDNLVLADVSGLSGLQWVGGDLTVTDNPALAAADADALVVEIDQIDGAIDVGNNGP